MYLKHSLIALGFILASAASAQADIFRWDNGQLIPGTEGITPGPGVQLDHRELEFAQLSNRDLTDSRFDFSNLVNAFLYSSTLTSANLSGAVVTGAKFHDTTSRGFTKEQLYSTASYQAKNLPGIGLGGNDLSGWNLAGQNLAGAIIFEATLANANLSGANLAGAYLPYTTLTDANLSHANLVGVPFYSAMLTNANLTDAVITGAYFDNTTSRGFAKEQLYSTASYKDKVLSGISLIHNDHSGWDFASQDLAGALFHGSILTGANLRGANLTVASFFGYDGTGNNTPASLNGADLTNAVVQGANFSYTTFTKEQLYSTASYQQKNLQGIGLRGNDLSGWNFAGQNLAGANFYFADLSFADLSQANLTGAVFDAANLSGADLTDSIVVGARFQGRSPDGSYGLTYGLTKEQLYSTASYKNKDISGIFLGSCCPDPPFVSDLSGWNFAGQNLANASLYESYLTNANLSGANLANVRMEYSRLTNANLSFADTRGALSLDLSETTSPNAILPDGTIAGLNLAADNRLVVHDDDGVSDAPTQLWLVARPPIPVNVQNHMTMGDGGVLQILFDADPWDSTIFFQPGIPVTLGGTLELTFATDVDLASQVGRTFDVFDWTGVNPTGQFQFASPYVWDLSNLYTTGEVTLAAVPEPGGVVLLGVALLALAMAHLSRVRANHHGQDRHLSLGAAVLSRRLFRAFQ